MQIFYSKYDTGVEIVIWSFDGAQLRISWDNLPNNQRNLPPKKGTYLFHIHSHKDEEDTDITSYFWEHIKESDQEWMMRKMIQTVLI
jgi:hypothetical protein